MLVQFKCIVPRGVGFSCIFVLVYHGFYKLDVEFKPIVNNLLNSILVAITDMLIDMQYRRYKSYDTIPHVSIFNTKPALLYLSKYRHHDKRDSMYTEYFNKINEFFKSNNIQLLDNKYIEVENISKTVLKRVN